VARAASAAFPPFIKIDIPVDDASGCDEATHPLVHKIGERRELYGRGEGSEGDEEDEDVPVTEELCQSAISFLIVNTIGPQLFALYGTNQPTNQALFTWMLEFICYMLYAPNDNY
jgi:hypothetical protein